ncbi:hypothetical protein [Shewanella colwelliana]|uniref:hypothetical protein n=1 Tax=Shewanella colwelliana TaxID=23 RepID=UPI00299D056A|nr:hypothetical protein [Shewanella colwelliana]MDX1282978.1 hypothetical protein [Shewanella colwelliana]
MKPNDVIQNLPKQQQDVLKQVLAIERKYMHIKDLNNNKPKEKAVMEEIVAAINRSFEG